MTPQIITRQMLDQLGIELGDQDVEKLLIHLNETLEERVGAEVTESLSDEQLEELSILQETASDEEVGTWINNHVEDLEQLTQDEVDILLGELAENSDAISES